MITTLAVTAPLTAAGTPHAFARPTPSSSPSKHPSGGRHHHPASPSKHATHSSTAAPPATTKCNPSAHPAKPGPPWPQQQLGFENVWPITRGAGVVVAVIDSGLDTSNPQLRHLHLLPGVNTANGDNARDCVGHGTEVTAIIAARPRANSPFAGVAPDATILPIKQTYDTVGGDAKGTPASLARGIDAAVDGGARVANVSVVTKVDDPQLRAAVRRANNAGMIIVAAVGNDGQTTNHPMYPAAYSPRYPNVIAVSASVANDTVPGFPEHGRYVDVAAPGAGYTMPAPGGGFTEASGTSFAAPYVTGTVALMLAAHPHLTPAQVRDRLEQTADSPPVATPSPLYGYGVVNTALAVTAVLDDAATSSVTPRPAPLAAPAAPTPPDRHLQHLATAVALILLALAALVAVATAVVRGSATAGRRRRA